MTAALMVALPAAGAESKLKPRLEHAKAALLGKDLKRAGSDLRAAGAYLGKAAANAPAASKEGLEASAREMQSLAGDVEKGAVTDTRKIDQASARAYHALANERYVAASAAWSRHDAKSAGRALRAAADHLEDGSEALGKGTGDSARDVANGTREIARKLIQGSGWTTEEVGHGMDAFGRELADFGKRARSGT
ncbi:MAG: hypothetical protein LC126_30295 [Bryobacterales bacterium]|nr:hypothetical protein [Bryobacterales bacterium]